MQVELLPMHVYILFAHPHTKSFSREVLSTFTAGLSMNGHSYEVNDLYREGFQTDIDVAQYEREIGGHAEASLPWDVVLEHKRIAKADALAFIYPNWWSDAPAKLKGWFDRVWTYGYAYFYEKDGTRKSQIRPKKAIVICCAGHTLEHLESVGIADSMRKIMLEDRLKNVGFTDTTMEILGGMMPNDESHRLPNLERVRAIAASI